MASNTLPDTVFPCILVPNDFLAVNYYVRADDPPEAAVVVRCTEELQTSSVNLSPIEARRLARCLNNLADRCEGVRP